MPLSFSLAFGDTLGGFIGNPATYFMFNNVGAAPNSAISANIPLSLYAIFQLKVSPSPATQGRGVFIAQLTGSR